MLLRKKQKYTNLSATNLTNNIKLVPQANTLFFHFFLMSTTTALYLLSADEKPKKLDRLFINQSVLVIIQRRVNHPKKKNCRQKPHVSCLDQ